MRIIVSEWVQFLETDGGVLGIVLVLCGLGFLLTGWRFARVSLVAMYAMTGLVLGCKLGASNFERLLFAVLCGSFLSTLGVVLKSNAAPVLAGVLGSLTCWAILGPSSVPPPTLYIVLGLAFLGIMALAAVGRRETTIVLTSFVGALLLVSGLIAVVSESRSLGLHYQGMSKNGFFFPFVLLVPTVSGILLQLGAANRSDAGDTKL